MSQYAHAGKDFYKVLKVPPSATLAEIKQSYRQLALQFHPDTHNAEPSAQKRASRTQKFKALSEAYAVLSNERQKRDYDAHHGFDRSSSSSTGRTNFSGRPLSDFRKVYTSAPPPEWKGKVWDHQEHYAYHYGTGMQDEAIESACKTFAKEFEYQSPLGPGFTFDRDPDANFNPYSKRSAQGPPTVTFEYSEGYQNMNEGDGRRAQSSRRSRVVHDLYGRREERRQQEQARHHSRSQSTASRPNAAFESSNSVCIIS